MGVSILDAHPNNECVDFNSSEAWFSFIFCGNRIDKLNLRIYDYYTEKEVVSGSPNTIYSPSIHTNLAMRGGVGNGVRVNIKDFVKDAKNVFKSDGEYTWRAELIQKVNLRNGIYPDNMVYEGAIVGEPMLLSRVANVKGFDYDNYLPLSDDISERIKPPYYVDFLDTKYNGKAYDIPVTYDETRIGDDGTEYTAIKLTTYTSTVKDTEVLLRPAKGTLVLIHKKKHYDNFVIPPSANSNVIYIDPKISYINEYEKNPSTKTNNNNNNTNDNNTNNDPDDSYEGKSYLKVENEYFEIDSYDEDTGAVTCKNAEELQKYPAGTHYAVYTGTP